MNLYSRHFPGLNDINYPPVAIFLFGISSFLYHAITAIFAFLNNTIPIFPSQLIPLFESQNMQMGFMKLPAIFADLGIGLYFYRIFIRLKYPKPVLLLIFFLFNPAIIYISSVWGQIESVTALFLVASLYHAFIGNVNHKYLSLFFFALAALTKQTALWFTPLYLFLWFKEVPVSEWARGVVASLTAFIFSYLPFGLPPVAAFFNYLSTLSGSSDYVSDAAWNLWWYFYPTPTSDSVPIGPVSIRLLSIGILTAILVVLIVSLVRKYSKQRFFGSLFLWSLAVFFIQTRVHERHLAFALIFVLLLPDLHKRYYMDYFTLTTYHMYNLYSILKLPFI